MEPSGSAAAESAPAARPTPIAGDEAAAALQAPIRKVASTGAAAALLLGDDDGGAAGAISQESGPPSKFLNIAVLRRVLEQAVSNGVRNALLLKLDGAPLCIAGDHEVQGIVGTLVASIWMGYDEDARALGASNFYFMVMNCELGKIAVARINRFLLCLVADDSVPGGVLKFKITAIVEHLRPLKHIYDHTAA